MKSIYDIHRDNLRKLIHERFCGKQVNLARHVGFEHPSFVSRLASDKPSTKKKIGDDICRKIEKKCDLPEFWMDHAHEIDEEALNIARLIEAIPPSKRSILRALAHSLDECPQPANSH